VARHPVPREEARREPHERVCRPAPREVVHDDAAAGHPIHLGEVPHGGRLVQMMERQGRDDHVDRPAPHGELDGIPLEDDDLG
jgi:hypothetical protein